MPYNVVSNIHQLINSKHALFYLMSNNRNNNLVIKQLMKSDTIPKKKCKRILFEALVSSNQNGNRNPFSACPLFLILPLGAIFCPKFSQKIPSILKLSIITVHNHYKFLKYVVAKPARFVRLFFPFFWGHWETSSYSLKQEQTQLFGLTSSLIWVRLTLKFNY